jgi:hypothetical protein
MSDSKKRLDEAYEGVMKAFDNIEDKGRKLESSLVFLNGLILGGLVAGLLIGTADYVGNITV